MHRIAPCAPYLPRRASDTNKYDYGRVLIVGGCIGYTGAPTLCAHAALRCGAHGSMRCMACLLNGNAVICQQIL